jgi:exosortase E/protease (VPEID-CTERM system)
MGGFLYRFRSTLRFPNALWLLPLGMAAVWFGNALRIAALMIVGARLDPAIAVGSFHSKAGWVFFCAITLAVAALGRRLPFFAKRDGSDADGEVSHDNPTAPLLLPVLCWIGIGLVTSTFSEGHDPLYALRVVGSGLVLALYRDSYRAWLVRPALLSFGVGAAVGVAWLLPLPGAPSADSIVLPVPEWSAAAYASWIAFRIVGAVVVVPSCEELAFRGYLMRWLTKREFWDVPFASVSLFAITLSSLVFGLLHDRWLLGAASGVVYAWLVRRSGRLSDGVAAHAASNLVIAAWVLATGQFQHW